MTKGGIYYTDSILDLKVATVVRDQLKTVGLPIVSVSLEPIGDFGKNICLPLKRGYLAMFKQILAGLEASDADIIFHLEHDVLYPKEYFDFTPPRDDKYYYNINWWRVRLADDFAVSWEAAQVSGLCAYRKLLLEHYRKKVAIVEQYGYCHGMGFEPGSHNDPNTVGTRNKELIPSNIYVDDICIETWRSPVPQVDIKHGHNLSVNKWGLRDFRNKAKAVNFREGKCPDWAQELVAKMKI